VYQDTKVPPRRQVCLLFAFHKALSCHLRRHWLMCDMALTSDGPVTIFMKIDPTGK